MGKTITPRVMERVISNPAKERAVVAREAKAKELEEKEKAAVAKANAMEVEVKAAIRHGTNSNGHSFLEH